jgi:iron uptake system component EfeO
VVGLPERLTLPARWLGLLLVAGVLVLGALLAWNHGREQRAAAADAPVPTGDASVAGTPVDAGNACGRGWNGGSAGTLTFAVWNSSINPVEVYLQDQHSKKVYLDVENLGSGATRSARVALGPGTYEFVCLPSDGNPVHGTPQQVTGQAPRHVTPGVVPITENQLSPVVTRYERWVRGQVPALVAQTSRLDADVRAGDLQRARRDWLAAHLRYETLGAAYGAFGEDDTAINGLPSTTVAPARDPHLHGFHKVEAMLWTGRTAGLARETGRLVRSVRHLRHDLATRQVIQPIDVGLRAHEILEDAVGQVLTGRDDAGSDTGLATIDANIDGTWHALTPLLPLLDSRDPVLRTTQGWLHRTQRFVRGFDHHGSWTPLTRLGRAQRERLDADLTQTVELLSRVAVITDPRRGAQ